MAQVRIDFQRRRKAETFSWARVEPMRELELEGIGSDTFMVGP